MYGGNSSISLSPRSSRSSLVRLGRLSGRFRMRFSLSSREVRFSRLQWRTLWHVGFYNFRTRITSPSEIFREVRQRHVVEAEDREILQLRYPLGQPAKRNTVIRGRRWEGTGTALLEIDTDISAQNGTKVPPASPVPLQPKDRSSQDSFSSHLGMGLDEKSTICSAWHPLMFSGMSGMSGREEGRRESGKLRVEMSRAAAAATSRQAADATAAELSGVKAAGAKRKCTF